MKHLILPSLSLLLAAPLAAQGSLADDFEGGVNAANWTFGVFPADVIEPTGGNPNSWLHNSQIDMFTVILHNDTATGPWVGDYRATGVSRIHFDAQTISTVFGSGGRNMSVLLRDTKGTVAVDDDDYAYSIGLPVPVEGAGWFHYNFEIPSQSTAAVPPGWKGGWVGDGDDFRPGIDWNDVITSVDVVEIWWQDPALFSIFQTWDAGVDNMTIEWNSPVTVSLTPGTAGTPNTLSIDNASANSMVLFAGSTQSGITPFSCNGISSALSMASPRSLGSAQADGRGDASVSFVIPPSFSGTTLYFQGLDTDECRLSDLLTVTVL